MKLVRAPLLSLALFVSWLLLNNTVDPAHLVLGAVLAVAIPLFTEPLRPDKPRLRRLLVAAQLALVVLWDIVMSNIVLARRILGPEPAIRPRFVWVPLSIRDPHGIVTLAGIITMTPGTLSSDLSEDRRWLLVHAFNVEDEAALVATIKRRYEAPLREIFE
jgi:multicomponent K+:H+ antiporter subunit E